MLEFKRKLEHVVERSNELKNRTIGSIESEEQKSEENTYLIKHWYPKYTVLLNITHKKTTQLKNRPKF